MSAISRAIVITGRGWPPYLISKNKRICLWHQQLANVSNAWVIRAFKLVEGIDLGPAKKYHSIEVFVESKDSVDSRDNS